MRPWPELSAELRPFLLLGLLCCAVLLPGLMIAGPESALDLPFQEPSRVHLLGTGAIGQDLLAELVHAARVSLGVAVLAALVATVLGLIVGLAAGYRQGLLDDWLMLLTDVFMLLPGLPLIILLAAYLDVGLNGLALIIGLTAWPSTARVVRAKVLQISRCNYVKSAEAMGAGSLRIMFGHILPNIYPLIVAKATLAAAAAMVAEAGLSFLGLGDARHHSWGAMLHEVFTSGGLLNGCYWWYLPPIACISLTVLGLSLLGRHLLEAEEPACGPRLAPSARQRVAAGADDSLRVDGLTVEFCKPGGTSIRALDCLDLTVRPGERLALVGQTGSGKSVLLLAMLGLLPANAQVRGSIRLRGCELTAMTEKELQAVRGRVIAYVPQGSGLALNPLLRVGYQVAEQARAHHKMTKAAARGLAIELLAQTGIRDAASRSRDYPHRFSGGMLQRALVAMGLAARAPVVLLDEPSKGLDNDSRAALLDSLLAMDGQTLIAVTHDLDFAEGFARRVVVMLEALVVEVSPARDFFEQPLHPYSLALRQAQPARGLQVPTGAPQARDWPQGCPFAGRCALAGAQCQTRPPLCAVGERQVRCWRYAA